MGDRDLEINEWMAVKLIDMVLIAQALSGAIAIEKMPDFKKVLETKFKTDLMNYMPPRLGSVI